MNTPPEASPRIPRRAAAVAAVIFICYVGLVVTGWPNRDVVAKLTQIAFPAATLVYIPLAALAAKSSQGRLRAAWLTLAAAFCAWGTGEMLWLYYREVVNVVPFPSWADVAYLSYVPLVAVALLLFPSTGTWLDRSRLIVDGLIVTGSFFLISWLTVMRQVWQTGGGTRLEFALTLAYPAGDVLIMTVGVLVLVRAPAGLRTALGLLVAALACSALGNGLWAYLGDAAGYEVGGLADIFYGANILLVIVALIAALHARPGDDTTGASPGRLSLWLPLLPVAVAAVFVLLADHAAVMEAPVVVAGVLLIVATLVRQLMQGADLVQREKSVRHLADRLNGELDGAAAYVASILPGDLSGAVSVSSRYLPSRAVGGDSFGYAWIDDDHLMVYLIDVSGHGVRPALLSVSIHNLLRSNSLRPETLRNPDQVLSELNDRFSMKNQDGHYFTMWYGVYRLSTARLRYASAGHPPALMITGTQRVATELPRGDGMPLGMFAAGRFSAEECTVAPGSEVLLYSDGVVGDTPRLAEFAQLCGTLARTSPDWLDSLVRALPVSSDGHYPDDCSLVRMTFPQ